MPNLRFDSRGRITLPADLRKRLGEEVAAILTPRGVLLVSVPKHIDLPVAATEVSGEDAARAEVERSLRGHK